MLFQKLNHIIYLTENLEEICCVDQTQTNMFTVCAKLDAKLFAASTIILQNSAQKLNYKEKFNKILKTKLN